MKHSLNLNALARSRVLEPTTRVFRVLKKPSNSRVIDTRHWTHYLQQTQEADGCYAKKMIDPLSPNFAF